MTIMILSIILFLIFTVLGGIHVYWLIGGDWGLKHVIPTKTEEANSLAIPKLATLVVALGLLTFGYMYLVKSELVSNQLPTWLCNLGYWFIPTIFTLRAIGEFKYVGLFKKVKDTKFAKADTKIFVPLCLFIGLIGLLIQVITG